MGRSPSAVRAAALVPFAVVVGLLAACSAGSASATPASPSTEAVSSIAPAPASEPVAASQPAPSAAPPSASAAASTAPRVPFRITSPSFGQNGPIPARFTCHGADRSPALAWSGVPAGVKALVLTVRDPDARDFVHWTVLDLDPARTSLPEGVAPTAAGIQQGRNGFGNVGYGGPCPPSGTHHYRFTLAALAAPLGLAGHPSGADVERALATATVVGTATLIGTFAA